MPFLAALLLSLCAAATAAAAPGDWSRPVPVAADAFPRPIFTNSITVASDGESYLVVTTDSRGHRALRVDSAGTIVDLNGISLGPAGSGDPVVVGNGSEWLVLTGDGARIVQRDGRIAKLGTMPLRQAKGASNGRTFLLASNEDRRAAVIQPDGRTTWITLAQKFDAVASNGDVYCLAAINGNSAIITIIDDAGRVRFTAPLDVPLNARRIALARVHGNFRLLWTTYSDVPRTGEHDVRWSLSSIDFTPAGALPGAPREMASGSDRMTYTSVFNPALSVTQAGPADAIVRWSTSELRQTTLGCGTSFAATPGTIASNGRSAVLVTLEQGAVLRAAAFTCDPGPLLAARRDLTSWATAEQSGIALAAGHNDAVALWSENGRHYARRVSHTGAMLGWLQLPEEVHAWSSVRLATDGWQYIVAWTVPDRGGLRFARLADAGAPAAPVVTVSTLSVHAFDVAWDGTAYSFVWSTDFAPLRVSRVSRDGALLEPAYEISAPSIGYRTGLVLSRGATGMLVAWSEGGISMLPCGGCQNVQRALALRLDHDGRPWGGVMELGGYLIEVQSAAWNDGAWYVTAKHRGTEVTRVSRIDDMGAETAPAAAALPSLPRGLDEPREAVFVRAGTSRMLAIFTSRENAPPHNGAHRAFVTSMQLDATPSRRRAAR
ncbi:MAG TPA: hypothetical protein VF266_11845 [Thermoanaerobaculia bacterium]